MCESGGGRGCLGIDISLGSQVYLTMPKSGEAYNTCGEWMRVESCENRCHPVPIRGCCSRPECPVCYESWARREAKSCTERLEGAEHAHIDVGSPIGTCRAFVVSPPQEWAKELILKEGYVGLKKIYKKLYELLKWAGFKGGVVVDHEFRAHSIDECVATNWEIELHFHILGYGWVIPSDKFKEETGGGEFGNNTGWVYKNLGVRGTTDDKVNSIFYYLTHRGLFYKDGKRLNQCVRYFGCAHWRIVGRDEIIRKEVKECEKCNREVHKWYGCEVLDVPGGKRGEVTIDWTHAGMGDEVLVYNRYVRYFIRDKFKPKQMDITEYGDNG